jgi:hypothetical protein
LRLRAQIAEKRIGLRLRIPPLAVLAAAQFVHGLRIVPSPASASTKQTAGTNSRCEARTNRSSRRIAIYTLVELLKTIKAS